MPLGSDEVPGVKDRKTAPESLTSARLLWWPDALGVTLAEVLGVERKGSLALACARYWRPPGQDETASARRRVSQVLEAEAALGDAVRLAASLDPPLPASRFWSEFRVKGLADVVTVAGWRPRGGDRQGKNWA